MKAEMPGLSLHLVTLWPSASPREEPVVGGVSGTQQVLQGGCQIWLFCSLGLFSLLCVQFL